MPAAAAAKPDALVGAWLLVVCALVTAMILVGGATRLTESGLSITEWNLAKQLWPPMTDARWQEEFDLYRRTVEYQVVNRGMSLEAFQTIYWWEWGHRFLGKVVGVMFAVPFLTFLALGRLRGRLLVCTALFALGGLQGAIGWWMVTSGLFTSTDVSPVRLATHLGMAFLILGLAWRTALGCLAHPARDRAGPPGWMLAGFAGVLFVQIVLGALVAGANAGGAYTDWPTIGGALIPADYAALSPWGRNMVENPAALQFNHRTLGYVAALGALVLGAWAGVRGRGARRWLGVGLAVTGVGQAGLGVWTILSGAPLDLSLAHQGGAVALWLLAGGLWWLQTDRREPATVGKTVIFQPDAISA